MTRAVHPAELTPDELLKACEVARTRGSGPGGQHRNKVETAIVMTHLPTGIVGQASERRSQRENHSQALQRLRTGLALETRVERGPLAGYQPSELWLSRLRGRRMEVAATHADFPALLAETLDLLAANAFDVGPVAAALRCSTTQLVRFLAREPRALALVNRHRAAGGKAPLRA
jgi:hypothetical protein